MRLHSLFSVPPTTQAVKLVEAIDLEAEAPVEASKISPPETAVAVVVTAFHVLLTPTIPMTNDITCCEGYETQRRNDDAKYYHVPLYDVDQSVFRLNVIEPLSPNNGPVYSLTRFLTNGAAAMVALPITVSSLFLQSTATSVFHSVADENPKILTASLTTPISDDGILTVIVLLTVASDGSPVV